MTVSFRTRAIDTWFFLCYLATRTVTGRCLLVLLLITPITGPAEAWYQTVPGSKAEHFAASAFIPAVLATYALLAFALFLGIVLGMLLTPRTTVTISAKGCRRKEFFERQSSWKRFAKVEELSGYYYFAAWNIVFFIPKLAFSSGVEAEAFFATALTYWRNAKGLPPPPVPETLGVWPPAPRPANSAEPGGSAEC